MAAKGKRKSKSKGKPPRSARTTTRRSRASPRSQSGTPTGGQASTPREVAREAMQAIREQQRTVPYTPAERAEIERLNRRQEQAIAAHHASGGAFNLTAIEREIARKRVAISSAARRRASGKAAEGSGKQPSMHGAARPGLVWSVDEGSPAFVLRARDERGGRYSIAATEGPEGPGWIAVAHDAAMPHGRGVSRVLRSQDAARTWAEERLRESVQEKGKRSSGSKARAPAASARPPTQRQLDRALTGRHR